MSTERRGLRSWRERVATPLRTPEPTPTALAPQTSDLPRQRLVRTGPNTWKEAEWARGLCVFCDAPAVDVIACAGHRAKLDQLVMPWEGR